MAPGGSKTRPTTLTASLRAPRALSNLFFFSAFRYAGHFRTRLVHEFATDILSMNPLPSPLQAGRISKTHNQISFVMFFYSKTTLIKISG